MPNFKYKIRDKFGKLVTGTTTAENESAAVGALKEMGYIPISVTEIKSLAPQSVLTRFNRVHPSELLAFTRQFHSMEKSGIPILSSLEALAQETKNKYFSFVISEMARDVREGSSFSATLEKHKDIFDPVYTGMVKAAESAGKLDEIFGRLNELVEHEIAINAQIKSVTRYPKIVLGSLLIGFLILVTFVVPRFATIYGQFNAPLPLPTRILIGTYEAIKNYWYIFLLAGSGLVYAFMHYINSVSGRKKWDMFKIKVPVFGKIILMLIMARFARVTALLIKSGVPILELLELSAVTVGNVVIAKAIMDIKDSVNQGKGLSAPMRASNLFPATIIQMVTVGEQSGRVDELLMSVADYYESESNYTIKNLITYIEPTLLFILAIMVLIMALGIYMPMWNLMKVVKPA